MQSNCRAELCEMWDGDGCPCFVFGLDPDRPPSRGIFAIEQEET